MTAQETGTANWYSTVLSAPMGATDTSASVDSIVGVPDRPCYLVVEPDNASQREVMLFTGLAGSTFTGATVATNRYLAGSAAGSGLSHPAGSVVECRPIAQLFTDLNDRVDGSVAKSLFDANSILVANADDTPLALTVAASRFLGRKASGDIAAMTVAEAKTLLALVAGDIPDLSATYAPVAAGLTAIKAATVTTNESTTSDSFTDLATVGPAVTITIPASGAALFILTARVINDTANSQGYMGVSGGGLTADVAKSLNLSVTAAGGAQQASRVLYATGLTTGSQTFTAKYRRGGNTASFDQRQLVVIPLP